MLVIFIRSESWKLNLRAINKIFYHAQDVIISVTEYLRASPLICENLPQQKRKIPRALRHCYGRPGEQR